MNEFGKPFKKSDPKNKKKHSRTSPDVKFKEFSLTNRKLDQEWTMNGLGRPFRKKIRSKKSKKQ